ncbi:trace amine-associated receptor 13c-like [Dunckerocampus dactyliophorus]|uniref:trace amine-associated receptor 13c-like n=1 Tax=Dunckerocampus dactyliophorus TaxID=161453 RepID=UPI0024059DAC|nr:trace amine-associated receptor 13c-like [Dunckerocampus dactyliophorus]
MQTLHWSIVVQREQNRKDVDKGGGGERDLKSRPGQALSLTEMAEEAELCFPLLANTSCRRTPRPRSAVIGVSLLLSVMSLLTIILNLLVIISIAHFRQLQTTTNLLLLSLASSDFLVGFFMLFQIFLLDSCWLFGDLMCALLYILDHVITSASIGSMVLISVERYVAICDPLGYPIRVTKRRVGISIVVCWSLSSVFNIACSVDTLQQPGRAISCVGECLIIVTPAAGLADLFFSFVGPITTIVMLNMRVFVVAMSQARVAHSRVGVVTARPSHVPKSSELKAARTLGVVVAVFVVCIMPFFCVVISGQDVMLNALSSAVITCLFYFNSCLNPLIYAIFYPWFRRSIKLIVTLQIVQPDSSMANLL